MSLIEKIDKNRLPRPRGRIYEGGGGGGGAGGGETPQLRASGRRCFGP